MIFQEDNTNFSFHATPVKSEAELRYGLWLTLVGVHETPPHIAIISEGKYYSLSTRKVDHGSTLARFINTIERKHVPSLFIQIEQKDTTGVALEKAYKKLQPLGNLENTCLSPVKDFFTEGYSGAFRNVNYVYELLAIAQKQGLLQECISLFCEDTNSNIITLPKYTTAQIQKRIQELSSQITSA